MRKNLLIIISLILICSVGCSAQITPVLSLSPSKQAKNRITLPPPQTNSQTSLEMSLASRRSVREYLDEPISLENVSQLLWAAQGFTSKSGLRTAPSAGALYPLELYLLAGDVSNLSQGIYKYQPQDHSLELVVPADKQRELGDVALKQQALYDAAAVIVFTAIYERTMGKYGQRGIRYVHMEVGHAAQNVYLQAVSQNLGTVFIGAFYDEEVKKVIQMQNVEQPLGLMPVGKLSKGE